MIDAVAQFLDKNYNRADKYREIIEDMLDYGAYQYASDTLEGILEDIKKEDRITDAEVEAVNNIRAKPSYDRY